MTEDKARAKVKPKTVLTEVEKKIAPSDLVSVENYSKDRVCVSTGILMPGDKGECTLAEANSYNRKLRRL